MLKKLSITLTTLLCAGMLVACGNTTSKQDKGNESKPQTTDKKVQDVKPSAKVKTDATGNHVASESIYFEPEKEEALIFNDSYSHGDYTYIPEGHMEILSRKYVGYKGESDTLITRKTKDIRSVQFDNLKEKRVSEFDSE